MKKLIQTSMKQGALSYRLNQEMIRTVTEEGLTAAQAIESCIHVVAMQIANAPNVDTAHKTTIQILDAGIEFEVRKANGIEDPLESLIDDILKTVEKA